MDLCPNCGTAVAESYCPTCGQKYEDDRFTLTSVLTTTLKEVVDLERGGLATLVGLSRAPGRVVRDYWSRCTRPYLNPAKYFLFAVTVLQLVMWQTGIASNAVKGFLAAAEDAKVSHAQALRFFGDFFVLFFATGLPVLPLATYWGTERNLAEHAIFHLYVSGHIALLWSLAAILMAFPIPKLSYLLLPVAFAYYIWTYISAHRPDTSHSLWRACAQAVGSLVVFAVLYTGFMILLIGFYVNVLDGSVF